MRRYIPLLCVELYLLGTIFVLFFGPLNFNLHNLDLFLVLIASYHISFVLGYFVSLKTYKLKSFSHVVVFSSFNFFFILFFATLACLVTYKNVSLSTSIIPWDIFKQVYRGVSSPAEVYVEKHKILDSGVSASSRFLNVISVFFMFFKFLFIFYCIYWWRVLEFYKKMIFFMFCFLFISPSLSGGISSILFYFFIFTTASLVFVKILRGELKFLRFFLFSIVLLAIPIGFFGYMMSLRGGGFDFFNTLSPLGDISARVDTPEIDTILGFYYYSFVWLSSYIVQGYYGFSLALGYEWIWTYGFGSSHFLQSQLLIIAGVDVSDFTFQSRVSHLWDEKAMWHSFYGQIANDVGFVGVSLVIFLFGFLLARVWASIIYEKSFYGSAMMPILVIFFIFLPANNQVFGFIDTISYFFAILVLWFFEGKRIKV